MTQKEKLRMFTDGQTNGQTDGQEDAGDAMYTMYKYIGEMICKRNPYGTDMKLSPNWQYEIEEDYYEIGSWHFKDRSPRIAKAIRIPYTYRDGKNNLVREYLLIGYEGAGGE